MKKIILAMLISATMLNAGFFDEKDKQLHMKVSVPFGAMGALVCKGNKGFNLSGWKAIACGTAFGMIPGVYKEYLDSKPGGSGWDNRDLGADAIGAFVGAVSTVTIWQFSSGEW